MSECSEIAATLTIPNRKITFVEASAIVRESLGSPAEVGHQIFDNVAMALVQRSKARVSRWVLVDGHFEFDGVPVFSAQWPESFGSFTPERVAELLNEVTVSGT